MACFADDIGPLAYMMAARSSARVASAAKPAVLETVREGVSAVVSRLMFETVPGYGPVTGVERAVVLGATGYGLWALSKLSPLSKLSALSEKLVPGVRAVKNFWTGRPKVVVDSEMACTRATVLESRRAGSEEVDLTCPTAQARVGFMRGGQFVVIGACTRLNNYLVGPDHVLGGTGERLVFGRQSYVSLAGKIAIPLATDLVAFEMTERELSTIGITMANVGTVPDNGVYAQIVGPLHKGTTGLLRNDARCFGRVVYEGTTMAGYSGSLYTSGTMALGIHQMGGQINGGYSISYALAMLRVATREKVEASEDWLLGQMKLGRKIRWDPSSGSPDEVSIQINGVYSIVERDAMIKAFGRNWETDLEYLPRRQVSGDYESGEASTSRYPGASSVLGHSQEQAKSPVQDLMAAFSKLSSKQQKNFRKLLTPSQPQQTTNGQEKSAKQMSS